MQAKVARADEHQGRAVQNDVAHVGVGSCAGHRMVGTSSKARTWAFKGINLVDIGEVGIYMQSSHPFDRSLYKKIIARTF